MQELFEGLMETTLAYDTDREVLMCHNSLCEKIINRKNKISNSNKVVKRMKLAAAGGTNAHRGKHFQSVQVKSWVLCESHLPIKPNSAIILQFLNIYGPVPTIPHLSFIICYQKWFSTWKSATQLHLFRVVIAPSILSAGVQIK